MQTRERWCWAALACLVLGFVPACAPSVTSWSGHLSAGEEAVQQGHYAEAESQFVEALREAEGFGSRDVRLAVSRVTLGELYYVEGKHEEADRLYEEAQATLVEAASAPSPLDTTTGQEIFRTLNRLEYDRARLYTDQGRYAEAEPLLQRALAISEKTRGPEHPDVAVTFSNLGLVYLGEQRYTEAEPLFQQAVVIFERGLGPANPHVAQALLNYATLLRKTNRESEAIALETRAKALTAKKP